MKRVQIAKISYILTSVLIFLIGCVFLIFPDTSLTVLCRVVGAVIAVSGIAKLFGYFSDDLHQIAFQFDLALGVLTTAAGVLILIFPHRFSTFLVVIVAIFVLINALFTIQNAIESRRFGIRRWWLLLLGGILAAVFGIIALTQPTASNRFILQMIGIALMTDALQNIIVAVITLYHQKHS